MKYEPILGHLPPFGAARERLTLKSIHYLHVFRNLSWADTLRDLILFIMVFDDSFWLMMVYFGAECEFLSFVFEYRNFRFLCYCQKPSQS